MELIEAEELLSARPGLKYFGGDTFAKFLMRILQFDKVNSLYKNLNDKNGVEFIDALLEALEIKFYVDDDALKRIPKNGGFVIVSNHPFGGLDGLFLLKLISQVRPDIKILANFLLSRIDPIKDFFISVNPFEVKTVKKSSVSGLKQALKHVQNGGVLAVFPAGEVSSYDQNFQISDNEWHKSVIKLIKRSEVPVLPVYFSGSNSKLFHFMGKIHPQLRTMRLASELFNKKDKPIDVKLGSLIKPKTIREFDDIHKLGRYLRARTYALGAKEESDVKRFFRKRYKGSFESVIDETPSMLIEQEIRNLRDDFTLFQVKNFTVFCAPSGQMPNVINEIGRLREITFRAVGEGTNLSIDLDDYDSYYHQLFIWDEEACKIVGAYRVGLGKDIYRQYGINGFYVHSLFKLKQKLAPVLQQTLELGRSFVRLEYQRKPLPLFLLWKGILYFLLKNEEYRYLIGPVSISNNYSSVSKTSMIKFIKSYNFENALSRLVRPRHGAKFDCDDHNVECLLESVNGDLEKFDKLIRDIDCESYGIPVLLKKYLSLNAKIMAFNVDPDFNNSLDGLIILDLYNVPSKTIELLSREFNNDQIACRFNEKESHVS